MRVKFSCNWCNSSELGDRIFSNYVTQANYDPNIEIVSDSNYDYLFVINSLLFTPNITKESIFTFIMEPSWSPNWDRNCFEYSNQVFTHDRNLYGNHNNIIECPSFMFYHMNYKKHKIIDLLDNNNFDKKNKMSMVVSYSPNYNYKNYKLRTDLALKLLEYNFNVDIYGKGWPNYHKNIKGAITDKYDALINYEYSIAVENSCENNYVTEKFFDISLCNSTPIYYGAPNISTIYNNYETINLLNIEECLDKIRDILNNSIIDTEKIIDNKIRYFNEYNIYNKVKKIVNRE